MSFAKEVFWLGKPDVGYFPTWVEMKTAIDDIKSIGWNVATEPELLESWKNGSNWCSSGATEYVSPTLVKFGVYYAMYPISEESDRKLGGCGNTLGIQVFHTNSAGNPTAINNIDNRGGINVYAVKPNPDFSSTIPAGTVAKWSDNTKTHVLITINGRTYIIYPFNNIKKYYNSPAVLYSSYGSLVNIARNGYILPADCPDKIPPNYVPPGYMLTSECHGKITYIDKIVEKIPDGYIESSKCPVTYRDVDKIIEKIPDKFIHVDKCPVKVEYVEKLVTKSEVPENFIDPAKCPVTYKTIEVPVSNDSSLNIFMILFFIAVLIIIVLSILVMKYRSSQDKSEEQPDS